MDGGSYIAWYTIVWYGINMVGSVDVPKYVEQIISNSFVQFTECNTSRETSLFTFPVQNLSCNYLGTDGCKHICETLHQNMTLKKIDLSKNKFGDSVGPYLAEAFKVTVYYNLILKVSLFPLHLLHKNMKILFNPDFV